MKLEFTDQELNYTLNALARCPWGEVDPLMISLKSQIQMQQQQLEKQSSNVPQEGQGPTLKDMNEKVAGEVKPAQTK